MQELDVVTLRELLIYNPETGELFWRRRDRGYFTSDNSCNAWNARFFGKEAFTAMDKDGYRVGTVFGQAYKAHRIAFALHHGRWPTDQIDHKNQNKTDNGICNLRDVTRVENARNTGLSSRNTSGHKGVNWHKTRRKWRAYISIDGRLKHLGLFTRFEEAISSREQAEKELWA